MIVVDIGMTRSFWLYLIVESMSSSSLSMPRFDLLQVAMVCTASGLVAFILGALWQRRKARLAAFHDRDRTIHNLQNMARWTHKLADDVQRHESLLNQMQSAIASDRMESPLIPHSSPLDQELITIVQRLMDNNHQLREHLMATEQQLLEQSKELSNYIFEAHSDSLTGLANRRAFDRQLEDCRIWSSKSGETYQLILFDLDHFKSINDTFGHPIGDQLLIRFAHLLAESFRDALQIARLGGDEFAVILPKHASDAFAGAENFRAKFEQETLYVDGKAIRATVSGGLATISSNCTSSIIFQRADQALYAAKNSGRNRISKNHRSDADSIR